MSSDKPIAIREAATSLGVPENALRLYLASHGSLDGSSATVSQEIVEHVSQELRSRSSSMKLDDLAKASLTAEWLADAAMHSLKSANESAERLSALQSNQDRYVTGASLEEIRDQISGLSDRVSDASKQGASGASLQQMASLQGMLEAQSREVDKLQSIIEEMRREVAGVRQEHHHLVAALAQALTATSGKAPEPPGKVSAQVTEVPVAKKGTTEFPKKPEVKAAEVSPRFENSRAQEVLAIGVKREIDYNFLLERMGFRRLDAYTNDELQGNAEVSVPTDQEIRIFLCEYEVGGIPEEVEILTVHRGEYQMVQYQRIASQPSAGLKGWIPNKRR